MEAEGTLMPKLTMTKGLPGSGKSTWAKAQCIASSGQTKRVNKDDLRAMVDAGEWSRHHEKYIVATRDNLVTTMLRDGYNVIVDDTNLQPPHEPRLRDIAKECGATFAIQDFTDVPIEECIRRDLERPVSVGEKVIRKMWKQYLYTPPPEVPEPERGVGPRAIIVDIDGTVARMVARGPHDYDKVSTDEPKHQVIRVVHQWVEQMLATAPGTPWWHLIFCSGRPDSCREDTEAWLKEHVLDPIGVKSYEWTLHMRPTWLEARRESDKPVKDHRNDAVVKQEIYDKFILGRYDVDFVLDDRNRVVDMWRANGLLCLQVAPGDF